MYQGYEVRSRYYCRWNKNHPLLASFIKFADRFAERVVIATAGGSANAAAATGLSDHPAPSVGDVGKALDWWAAKAVQTDTEMHRLSLEERRWGLRSGNDVVLSCILRSIALFCIAPKVPVSSCEELRVYTWYMISAIINNPLEVVPASSSYQRSRSLGVRSVFSTRLQAVTALFFIGILFSEDTASAENSSHHKCLMCHLDLSPITKLT